MKQIKLYKLFEKPISGEWGNEPNQDELGIEVIRTTNFSDDIRYKVNSEMTHRVIDDSKIESKRLVYGDIIIEKSGGSPKQPVGRVMFYDYLDSVPRLCNNFTAILRPVAGNEPKFLAYLLNYLYHRGVVLKHQNKTTGIINLKVNNYLKSTSVWIPPYETQKQIVKLLDTAQGLIDARKEQIELVDELIKSLFYEMFGDPIINPKRWEKMQLKKSCNVITGNTPSRKDLDNYGEYIEWIKSDNINTPFTFLTKAEESLSKKGFEKGRYTEANSILMTCIAGSLNCIGNVAIVDRKVSFNQQINAIVPLKYETMFLYVMFLLTKKYIQNASSNSMKGIISKGKLQELEFIVPDRPVQELFAKKVILLEEKKQTLNQSLKELETNYSSLTQRAFKGELF